ncbi:MAG: hypothetical protein ACM3MI_01835, partial [Clostridiales bacterium]
FNIGTNYPLHFIPACILPVYASQSVLPQPTQDSVNSCWLSFAIMVISNHLSLTNFHGATYSKVHLARILSLKPSTFPNCLDFPHSHF